MRTLDEENEQIRRLRSLLYFMDHDLEDKSNSLKLDHHNKLLTEHSLNLSIYTGTKRLDVA